MALDAGAQMAETFATFAAFCSKKFPLRSFVTFALSCPDSLRGLL
jgi:hypothetical protein